MSVAIAHAAFVSFNFGEGRGGHYLSMSETIRSDIFVDPLVIDLGFQPTPPLDGLRSHFIPHGWVGHRAARRMLRRAITKAGTRVVFCYDIHSYNISARALASTSVQIVYVKCGGPTLTLYYPKPQAMIVFSDHDDAFFEQHLPNTIRSKISNRVSEADLVAKQTPLGIEAKTWLDARSKAEKIVCIARISHSYEPKIRRALDYLGAQRRAGNAPSLTLIGYIEHEEVFENFEKLTDSDVQILCDEFHTKDAARFLSNFDTAITTGRGTVEAVLCGLKVLVPYDNTARLAPLTPDNYEGLFLSNFSGRARPEELGDFGDFETSPPASDLVLQRVRSDFEIESAGPKFIDLIERLPPACPPSTKARIQGHAYFLYVALRARTRVIRDLSLAVRRWHAPK